MNLYKTHQANKKLTKKTNEDIATLNIETPIEAIVIYEESKVLTYLKIFFKTIFSTVMLLLLGGGISFGIYQLLKLF